MLKLGNAFLKLFQFYSPVPEAVQVRRPVCDHGITHLCLLVTDLDADYDRLLAAGMSFHNVPDPQNRAVYGRDPDGNVVELLEVLDPSSPMAVKV